jgi:tripartite motif-containing protein 71
MNSTSTKKIFLMVLAGIVFYVQAQAQQLQFGIQNKIGSGQTQSPQSVAIDAAGNIYVTDQYKDQVLKFSPAGVLLATFGTNGYNDGQFSNPEGLAVDAAGNVYVGDQGNYRVQKFSPNGNGGYSFIAKFGSSGSGDGQFGEIADLAVDAVGNVYVVDNARYRVQKFGPTGEFLAKFGSYGNGNGQFWSPEGVAVDAEGLVYVSDDDRQNVQKFKMNPDGTYSYLGTLLSGYGTEDGKLSSPSGLAIDPAGNVFIAERLNHRVQQITATGAYVSKLGAQGFTDGTFNQPLDVAVGPDGALVVVSDTRIQKFTNAGVFVTKLGVDGTTAGNFNGPAFVTTDANNHVYVTDAYNHRVQKFDANGVLLTQFGSYGSGDGQFLRPNGIVVDPSTGDVYVSDADQARIQKFTLSSNGIYAFALKFGTKGEENGQLDEPVGMAFDAAGNLWVADRWNNRVQKFSTAGVFLSSVNTSGQINGRFFEPTGIAIDGAGHLYVVDKELSRVQKLKINADGTFTFITQLGGMGFSGSGLYHPSGIAVKDNGDLYVADYSNYRLVHFILQANGSYSFGGEYKKFNADWLGSVNGVALDKQGTLYLTDMSTNLVYQLKGSAPGELQVKVDGEVAAQNATINYGNYSGYVSSYPVTIKNVSATNTLNLLGSPVVVLSGAQAGSYSVDQFSVPSYLAPNESATFRVKFNPSTTGTHTAQVAFKTNDPQRSTFTIQLTGTRIENSGELLVSQGATAIAQNGTHNFGAFSGTATTVDFTVFNNSSWSSLTFTGTPKVVLAGPQATAYTVQETNLPATLAAKGTSTFSVTFNPATGGTNQAQLSISTNTWGSVPYVVNLTGARSVASAKEELAQESVKVYPNPTVSQVTLDVSSLPVQTYQVQVRNAQGALVLEGKVKPKAGKLHLQVKDLAAGIYTVHLLTEKQFIVKRIIKH